MQEGSPIYFPSRQALRAWLEANHASENVLWVGFYKKASENPSVTYSEALDEALCFGWIDGVRHTVDGERYIQRFTPRRPGSNWSAINVKRAEALIAQGLMQDAGRRAFEARQPGAGATAPADSLPAPYVARLQASEAAWRYFTSRPPWYQRTCAAWVMDAKQEATRERRIATLIADCEAGRPIKPLARAMTG